MSAKLIHAHPARAAHFRKRLLDEWKEAERLALAEVDIRKEHAARLADPEEFAKMNPVERVHHNISWRWHIRHLRSHLVALYKAATGDEHVEHLFPLDADHRDPAAMWAQLKTHRGLVETTLGEPL